MASPLFRAQVVLERDGALPEDAVVNVMHFEGDINTLADQERARWDELAPGLTNRLVVFYQAIQLQLGAILTGNGQVKLYDMRDAKPRIPRLVTDFTFTPNGSTHPAEVALCVSFSAAAAPGVNPARRRGRIYLGPLAVLGGTITGGDARPSATVRNEILTAFMAMATGTADSARLAIYSSTNDPGLLNANEAWNDAVNVWIDDAYDTQRRRGGKATSRVTATIA